MRRRLRKHVNPFSLESLAGRQEALQLPEGASLEVELGCGDGLFIVERALSRAEGFYLGIDIRESFLVPGHERIAELDLDNVALETANLIVDLPRLFAPGSVRRIFINFPDPFFKRSQRHRRWLTEEAVEELVRALEEGGELIYQSDVWEPTLEALTLFSLHERLHNTCGHFSFCKGRLVDDKTSREMRCERQQRKIWRMLFLRR